MPEDENLTELAVNSRYLTTRRGLVGETENGLASMEVALGFPLLEPSINELYRISNRGIGAVAAEKLPESTWARPPKVEDDSADSPFSKGWLTLCEKFPVWSTLMLADTQLAYGHYSCIYFNLKLREDEGLNSPLVWGNHELSSLVEIGAYCEFGIHNKPGAQIITDGTNPFDERFALPTEYSITTSSSTGLKVIGPVHWSRILLIHAATMGGYIGEPRLVKSYDTLVSSKKLHAVPEALKKSGTKIVAGARQGFRLEKNDGLRMLKSLNKMSDDMTDNIIAHGFDVTPLDIKVQDPEKSWEMLRDWLAMETGIPTSTLFGARPNQAQGQSSQQYAQVVKSRQIVFATERILRPFIERVIRMGLIPPPMGSIKIGQPDASGVLAWPPLYTPSESEIASTFLAKAKAVETLVSVGVELDEARRIIGI